MGSRLSFGDAEDLINRIVLAEREVVFLVGAPLTAPTSAGTPGVPGVNDMVARIRSMVESKGRPTMVDAFDKLLTKTWRDYPTAFEYVKKTIGQEGSNLVIRGAVLEALRPVKGETPKNPKDLSDEACKALERHLEGWFYSPGVAALGELLATRSSRFGTVLTTNFDPLIGLAVKRAQGQAYRLVLHDDGSFEQAHADGTRIVHLHGYWYGADTLHDPNQLSRNRPKLRASMVRLLQRSTVVVLAYGGWDDIFTRTLAEVAQDTGSAPDVLWCFYGNDPVRIEDDQRDLLTALDPAIGRGRAVLYRGINCHAFLPKLAKELGSGAALAITANEPVLEDAGLAGRSAQKDELLKAFDRGQAVQIIGPRKMGKSSLLEWMKRHAGALGKRAALINARGLPRRSPAELVLAAATSLGKRAEVKAALYEQSAVPDAAAAAKALPLLAPAVLLVDEAGALVEGDHGFDKGFFDTLRSLGQARDKVQWISASEDDLFGAFESTGLTSRFLNDARKIYAGALSEADAKKFLLDRMGDAARVQAAYDLVGGFPAPLGWLVDHKGIDPTRWEAELLRWARPLFLLWWQGMSAGERALLKRAEAGSIKRSDLGDEERLVAVKLLDRGFLIEGAGGFGLCGKAWRGFVRDVG